MRAKVLCALMVRNGIMYHKGDYFDVESREDMKKLIQERCAEELVEPKVKERTKGNKIVAKNRANII